MQQQETIENLDGFVTKKDIQDRLHYICKTAQISDQNQEPQRATIVFECHKQKQQSDYLQSYQFKHYFIYLFAKNYSNTSKITMYQFQKRDGSQTKKAFNEISSNIKCMKLMVFYKKSLKQLKRREDAQTYFKILIGTSDGCLKILDPSPPYPLKSIKIDTKPLLMILDGDYTYFHNQNICIVLSQDNLVYFVDLDLFQIAFVLKPIIIMCDSGLSIKINAQQTHLMQCTEGGYVIFWKMDNILAQLKVRKQKKELKDLFKRHYGIFTQSINHTIAVEGLIWCDFYGNLLILVTKEGILKIVAYIFQFQGDFIQILNFDIGNPQAISHLIFFAELDMLLVSKNLENEHIIQKFQLDQEFRVQRVLKIVVEKIDFIHKFYINKDFDILVCQGQKCFVINQSKILLEQPEKQKIQEQKQY